MTKQHELSTMFIRAPELAMTLGYKPGKFDMFAAHINMVDYKEIFELARECIGDIKAGIELKEVPFYMKFFLILMPIWMLWPLLWPVFLPSTIERFKGIQKRIENPCKCNCGGCKHV